MTRQPSNDSGMSLIEITFAMAILATTLSLLFGSLISITVVSQLNEEKAVANTNVNSVLEELRGMPLKDLLLFVPELPDKPGVDRSILIECYDANGAAQDIPMNLNLDGAGVLVGPLPDLPNPLEVRVSLLWTNEKGHVFRAHATTSVSR